MRLVRRAAQLARTAALERRVAPPQLPVTRPMPQLVRLVRCAAHLAHTAALERRVGEFFGWVLLGAGCFVNDARVGVLSAVPAALEC